jgi:hypothetical protein
MRWVLVSKHRTDCDWFNLDTFLNVCNGWVVRVLVNEDFLAAEGVDKRGSACGNRGLVSLRDGLTVVEGMHTCA